MNKCVKFRVNIQSHLQKTLKSYFFDSPNILKAKMKLISGGCCHQLVVILITVIITIMSRHCLIFTTSMSNLIGMSIYPMVESLNIILPLFYVR